MVEKQLTNKIIKWLNEEHVHTTWVYKRFAIGNEAGKPDITGIHKGVRVEIEVKRPCLNKGSIEANMELGSKIQQHYIRKVRQYGGIAGVVCSVEQVAELLGL
jgi:penicillin-binding protein-related factor A (putative recombinase)